MGGGKKEERRKGMEREEGKGQGGGKREGKEEQAKERREQKKIAKNALKHEHVQLHTLTAHTDTK